MGIIQAPAAYTNDLAGKKARTKDQISRVSTMSFSSFKTSIQMLFDLVWKNPFGLTPQEAADSLGVDFGSFHGLFGPAVGLINAAVPGSLDLTEPKAVTVNSDGTGTIGA